MSASEYLDWMEYSLYEPFNTAEIQAALSLALQVRSKDNAVTYKDFMISRTDIEPPTPKKVEGEALDMAVRHMFG